MIDPGEFDFIVSLTKEMSGEKVKERNRNIDIPSLAKRICYALQKYVTILQGRCLRDKNLDRDRYSTCKQFAKIMSNEWPTLVSATAHASQRLQKT